MSAAERKTLAGRRRRRRHDRDFRHAARRRRAGGRASAVRVEAAQLHSGGRRLRRRHRAAAAACSPSAPLFPYAQMPHLPWWGLFACALVGIVGGLQSGLCTRCSMPAEDLFERLADPLDVVAGHRRRLCRLGRADRAARARRGLRRHRRSDQRPYDAGSVGTVARSSRRRSGSSRWRPERRAGCWRRCSFSAARWAGSRASGCRAARDCGPSSAWAR